MAYGKMVLSRSERPSNLTALFILASSQTASLKASVVSADILMRVAISATNVGSKCYADTKLLYLL